MGLYIDTPIQYIKGVGPKMGMTLHKMGIRTLADLFQTYPRAYEDRRAGRTISTLQVGEIVSIKAEVINVSSYNLGRSTKKIYDLTLRDGTGVLHCKFFRVPYRGYFERFQPHQHVRVIGKVMNYRGRIEIHHPDIQDIRGDEEFTDELIPIYSETEGITTTKLRKIMGIATGSLQEGEVQGVQEKLPPWILQQYRLPSLLETLVHIHNPPKGSGDEYMQNRSPYHHRVIFEEFFWLEFLLAAKKRGVQKDKAPSLCQRSPSMDLLQKQLPFELTAGQKNAIDEIVADLGRQYPMHRLVQGDVGCGKTLVSFMAAAVAIDNGYQVAIMVPTEILAQQHFLSSCRLLEPLGIRVGLMSGHLKPKERKDIGEKMRSGYFQMVVGTHALIQDSVEFAKLGLVIVDEQHRFGVEQRKKLKSKGESPHLLLMTATPIPRSLAMTVYGDLDVSIIKELPKGRQPIVTRVTYQSRRQKVVGFIHDHIKKGRQAYVVYPLVEESEKIDLTSATEEYEKLKMELPDVKIGLLHGKMKSEEKDEIMNQFRKKEFDILVSTTVIEVGVDVPNANIIWIDHAERFGLSQLHQLRGRVGRGEHKSYCILSLGFAVSEESKSRIALMENTSDGFKIAEADLELRGPGEFLGSRQSGLPGFKMANLVRDFSILKQAREAAFEVMRRDPALRMDENKYLREQILNNNQMIG